MADIYLVAGATGGTGQQIVSRLLRQNRHVRALVRNAEKGRALLGENLELMEGSTANIEAVHRAVQGVQTVICTTGTRTPEGENNPERVDYEGVVNLVNGARQAGVERFILVSSLAVTKPDHPLNEFGRVLEWKLKGEQALRESGLAYVIVRPGGLTDDPGGQSALQVDQGDRISGRISRADVAEVVVQLLPMTDVRNTTFEVIAADGNPPTDWSAVFSALKPDSEKGA